MPAFMQQQQQLQQQLVGPDSWQLLFGGLHGSSGITVTESQVDFGSCSRLSPCEARSFTVSNTTNAKLLVSLLVPPWQDPSGPTGKAVQVFQVSAHATQCKRCTLPLGCLHSYRSQVLQVFVYCSNGNPQLACAPALL
jgi:hypothetical protein